jgi:2-dehydropantoate 2-reductase
MIIAILGPGGVGGLLAGALDRAGTATIVVARPWTAELIRDRGLRLSSVRLGDFVAHPPTVQRLSEPVDVLIVSSKATVLAAALERIAVEPRLVLPLLNGLDHLSLLRQRFDQAHTLVVAGAIRVEADRPEPGVIVHTSPFLRIDMACADQGARKDMETLARVLNDADIPTCVLDSEPQVIWGKLVRLNALACLTSAYDKQLGEIRCTPQLRAELVRAIEEGSAVARAEGADIEAASAIKELEEAHATLGSSMQRDITAQREPELDAIAGAVLRAAARHGIRCPTIERLTIMIADRAGVPAPVLPS